MDKNMQRKHGIHMRKSLPEAELYSRHICDRLLSSPHYKRAKVILTYSPFNGEADVSFFNSRAQSDGKTLAYPICESDGIMVAAIPESDSAWETGKYGIKTPIRKSARILNPEEIDLVIVPCTAFAPESRMRLGMGAGYYDRYLPKCKNAQSVAVAYEVQKTSDLVAGEWDIPLDAVLTETTWY